METEQKSRIHPLVAAAAIAVTIVSAVGVAALTGHLPGSNAQEPSAPQVSASPPPVATKPARKVQHKTVEYDSERYRDVEADSHSPVARASNSCATCGVIAAVNLVEQKGEGSYLGMVGGGVVGALLGSQVGRGNGKTAAELAGAAGGAYAGNEIEGRAKTTRHYDVVVRLENGSSQTFTYAAQPGFGVGTRVRVENGSLIQN